MKAYRKKKKYLQTESIVLKVYDFGEADRIFTLLSPSNGIIRAVAKGIRKPKSRMGGHIDIMSKVNAYISIGENLSNLSQVEIIDNYTLLKKDLSIISIGFYLLELCEKFSVENDPNNDIYQHLSFTLDLLLLSANKNLLIRWFEINLLVISGFLPELYTCLISGEKLNEGDHLFSSINGGLVDKKYATIIKNDQNKFDNAYSKTTLSEEQKNNFENFKTELNKICIKFNYNTGVDPALKPHFEEIGNRELIKLFATSGNLEIVFETLHKWPDKQKKYREELEKNEDFKKLMDNRPGTGYYLKFNPEEWMPFSHHILSVLKKVFGDE